MCPCSLTRVYGPDHFVDSGVYAGPVKRFMIGSLNHSGIGVKGHSQKMSTGLHRGQAGFDFAGLEVVPVGLLAAK